MSKSRLIRILSLVGVALALFCCGVSIDSRKLSELEKSRIRFAHECFAAASSQTTPALISPLGLNLNMAVLARGSAGETRRNFEKLLPSSNGDPLAETQDILRKLGAKSECLSLGNEFSYDNWIVTLENGFLADIQKDGYCTVKKTTFPRNRKQQIFELRTTLKFDGEWETPFEPDNVDTLFFQTPDQPGEMIPMMTKSHVWLSGCEEKDWQSICLPFRDEDFVMLLLKPKARAVPASELFNRLSAETIIYHLENTESTPYSLFIPKFRTGSLLNCVNVLEIMGCQLSRGGDFSNLCKLNPPLSSFHSSNTFIKIYQSNQFEINEIRAKGESVTVSQGFSIACSSGLEAPQKEFIADRPFIYLLLHRPSKSVIFIGSYGLEETK